METAIGYEIYTDNPYTKKRKKENAYLFQLVIQKFVSYLKKKLHIALPLTL